jgi:hypothetical protein
MAAVSLGLLAGCATVSVVPAEATVETGLSQSQSALRDAAGAYSERAVEAGWILETGGLASLADTLMNGKDETQPTPADYPALIGASTQAPSLVLARISRDAAEARSGLANVTKEARVVLEAGGKNAANRNDVMSYERALVRAQMAHRNFIIALEEVSARPDFDANAAPVDAALDAMASTIDTARITADSLADRYAKTGRPSS